MRSPSHVLAGTVSTADRGDCAGSAQPSGHACAGGVDEVSTQVQLHEYCSCAVELSGSYEVEASTTMGESMQRSRSEPTIAATSCEGGTVNETCAREVTELAAMRSVTVAASE